MSDTTVIDQGREAWKRIRSQERLSWSDWIVVGKALLVGRAICMKAAQVNEPRGGRYNYQAQTWLADHGFDDVSAQERYRICKIVEHLDEVTLWRDSLPPEQRRRVNHPSHWASFCCFKKGKPRQRRNQPKSVARRTASGRPIYWSQDMIRRAGAAIRECRSNDAFVLARRALEAAIRHEDDLLGLLPPMSGPPRQADVAGATANAC